MDSASFCHYTTCLSSLSTINFYHEIICSKIKKFLTVADNLSKGGCWRGLKGGLHCHDYGLRNRGPWHQNKEVLQPPLGIGTNIPTEKRCCHKAPKWPDWKAQDPLQKDALPDWPPECLPSSLCWPTLPSWDLQCHPRDTRGSPTLLGIPGIVFVTTPPHWLITF